VTGYLLFPFFDHCLCHSGAFLAVPVPCSADDAFERFQDINRFICVVGYGGILCIAASVHAKTLCNSG